MRRYSSDVGYATVKEDDLDKLEADYAKLEKQRDELTVALKDLLKYSEYHTAKRCTKYGDGFIPSNAEQKAEVVLSNTEAK